MNIANLTHIVTGHKPSFSDLPVILKKNIQHWSQLNTGYALHYYSNTDQNKYLLKNCGFGPPNLCSIISLLGENCRAELFSYLYLYLHGGWWIDADTPASNILRSCSPIQMSDPMVLIRFDSENRPRHSIFASKPNHPIIYQVMKIIIHNTIEVKINRNRMLPDTLLYVTGPHNLHRAICDLMTTQDRLKYCGDKLNSAPKRWEGFHTHFGGKANTPTGHLYGSNMASKFRYISCNIEHHISKYMTTFRQMNFSHHTSTVAR
tara:strand:- start:441 stop:1226 length:786 start_codon:yes stop_codon:yes gene_type:complete